MKTIHKAKKCKTCKKVLNNCIAIRTTFKKARNYYYCNSKCFGEKFAWFMMDDLIEFVEIKEVN